MPEWDYRYYSFNSKWSAGQEMTSMRNGQGDAWFCVFSDVGVFLKGFDHESQMSPWSAKPPQVWRGVLDEVPDRFNPFATEPAFSMGDTTFCIWRGHDDDVWRTGHIEWPSGEDPDGKVATPSPVNRVRPRCCGLRGRSLSVALVARGVASRSRFCSLRLACIGSGDD